MKSLSILLLLLLTLAPSGIRAEEIRVGTWKTAQTIQPFFYKQFLPEGQKVTVFPFTNPADQRVALLAGSLQICGTTIAHAIHAASTGQPVVVVATLCNKCSALVVRKHGNIREVKELKGKKIGYVPGTMHEILLRETLTRNGLSPDRDVLLTRVDFFDMGMALGRGSIDAFLSGEPFPTMAVEQGYGRILSYPYYGETIGTINAGMIVHRETVEKNPDLVYKLVQAHAETTRYLNSHKDVWLKKASTFGTPPEILRKAEPNMELAWDMGEVFARQVRNLGKRMEALGVIQKQPDYEKLLDFSFVEKIRKLNNLK